MLLKDLLHHLEEIAPLRFAESWDNVGLLTGDPKQMVQRVLCCIDLTQSVLDEALEAGCELVVAYHPPLFKPIKRLAAHSVVTQACRKGVAVYSPHTALDVAVGGTNDVLADALGLTSRQPLRSVATTSQQCKLVTFVPAANADAVCEALFAAGAGHIGDYSQCSFRQPGQGTFFGGDSTQPVIGAAGRLERVEELRIEMVVANGKLPKVVAALQEAHPYEEPAFDLVPLVPPPATHGIGRLGSFASPVPLEELVQRVKSALRVQHVMVTGDLAMPIAHAAVCAGAGGELLDVALSQGAQLFVTGELRHHDALRVAAQGAAVIAALHSNSERAALQPLAKRLGALAKGIDVHVSQRDHDPFTIV